MAIPETLAALSVPISGLKPYSRNARQGDVGLIVSSLERLGQFRPIVVNARTSEVLAGNHTLRAAQELGWQEIAATFVDVDEDTAARINLVDNRSNDLAAYDDSALVELLQSLPDLEGTGFDGDALDELLADLGGGGEPGRDTDPIEPPAEPDTQVGDLYVLGEHRLLCGDSSDTAALERVFAGANVGCVLTDPPYGIGLDTDYSQFGPGVSVQVPSGQVAKTYRAVANDDVPFDASLLRSFFSGVREQFWFGGDYYRRTLSESDLDGAYLVWDKRKEGADDFAGSCFEMIWTPQRHKRDLLRHFWFGMFGAAEARERMHPTQKPLPLLEELLTRWAPASCIVADPFLGSGSTLIACENTGRSCYGLELDPGYCDVIVDRWERHTGKTAERTRDGETVEANA